MSNPQTSRILRTLPREKAFYFFTSIGNYTGKSATSLEEFVKEILDVNIKSLEFHLYRDDFEKWIAQTLEDNVLANKIKQLKALKPIGIDLRDRLYLIVSKHHENLKTPPRPTTTPTSTTPTYTKPKPTTITFGKTQSQSTVETQAKE
ncbi:MAG: DUF5752 family protein [Candidatus Bathyarchaeota archaeon]|nr:DUF5752 family protein [Candidatus Bathyarchaeota archaeon]MDH5495340.1 DUF5752 family protein [Candidatus Bathyarchaeota archaeon]